MDDFEPAAPKREPYHLKIDLRDVLGLAGGTLVIGAAGAIHWAAAAIVAGLGLVALSFRLAR